MILEAWNEGIGSAPNGLSNADAAAALLGTGADESIATILSFGYPAHLRTPREDVDGILERIKRKPLDELVVWVN
jgi:nitroreductase